MIISLYSILGTVPRDAWPARTEVTQNWSGFDANARERSAQQLLEDLGNIPQGIKSLIV